MAVVSWIVVIGKSLLVKSCQPLIIANFSANSASSISNTRISSTAKKPKRNASWKGRRSWLRWWANTTIFRVHPYQLYHVAMHEIKIRAAKAGVASTIVTPQSLSAIKAALDTALVREQQKFNKALFSDYVGFRRSLSRAAGNGTGVMITFAAIAATGDVNVAAIARAWPPHWPQRFAGAVAIPAVFFTTI